MPTFPSHGHAAVEFTGVDGVAAVVESCYEVIIKIDAAKDAYAATGKWNEGWIELTTAADPDREEPRRAFFCDAELIAGLTYASPESLEKWENEIS